MEQDDEEDAKVVDDTINESNAVELQPMHGRGNAKSGQKNEYLRYEASKVFDEVVYLCASVKSLVCCFKTCIVTVLHQITTMESFHYRWIR